MISTNAHSAWQRLRKVVFVAAILAVAAFGAVATVIKAPVSHAAQSNYSSGTTLWVDSGPALAGYVVHWSVAHYALSSASTPDPSNGHELVTDMWEAIGKDGIPTAYHSRTTFMDGSLHQEMWLTPSTTLMVFGQDYRVANPTSPAWCAVQGGSSVGDIFSELPVFANETVLSQLGQRVNWTAPTRVVSPPSPILTGAPVTPNTTYTSGSAAQAWQLPVAIDATGVQSTFRLTVGSAGQVVASSVQSTDSQGHLVADASDVRSPLEVYKPSDESSNHLYYACPNNEALPVHSSLTNRRVNNTTLVAGRNQLWW